VVHGIAIIVQRVNREQLYLAHDLTQCVNETNISDRMHERYNTWHRDCHINNKMV